jgi:hypothetical protein
MDSTYNIKRYMYNFRHPNELKEEALKKTYANILMKKDRDSIKRTVREENLNWDALSSEEKANLKHNIYQKLNLLGQPADDRLDFYVQRESKAEQAKFENWK